LTVGHAVLKQMVEVFSHYNTGVIAVQTVPPEDTDSTGSSR